MKGRNKDFLVGGIFLILTITFIIISMTHKPFFDWVFERHHNQWSWYLRPLFLLPFCYFAYKKSFAGMMISIFALFTSMFWFPKPEIASESVMDFLEFEKAYLYGEWNMSKQLLTLTIPISFIALGLAFWKRSVTIGIAVVVLMATGKMVWSIQNAGESGKSILIPAILGLLICCGLIFYGFKRLEKK
ncbi:hypothetical protein EV198_0575 [Roseivirga ehrenbergii]|uniref:Uncharacterized protein n=1 Tax=Roseivirga ehrenbergii (strain DSM 102268 / JCM 13514 / KCTC 12282 / NCIMB 14502 / KMM 6017) TaxID=279360 RepID=A0A150X857_ROSEK|nr:hypothetical protein [Roseivirga ehrenbergii]KYG74915.1 hypothetical protein MB14_06850 [Roseivirga ehrenbergii]TCL13745.1 hypothetical protein EV198_0575 [Roseivirga ehrenbergii]